MMKAKKKATAKKKVQPGPYTYLLKIAPSDARLIKEAAARRGLSINTFIGLASVGTARKVLKAAPVIPLPEEFMSAEYAA
jgi:uncharacterized protein (DUF1778 family)